MSYEELKAELEAVPLTWIPALLIVLVQRAVRERVFMDLQAFISRVVRDA